MPTFIRHPWIIVLIAALLLPATATARAKACIDWRSVMAQQMLTTMPPEGSAILVGPFTDGTKRSGDGWISMGLRNYLADLLATSEKLRVFSGLTAASAGPAPAHTITGIFQHLNPGPNGTLRVFIQLKDGPSGKLMRQFELSFPYPGNAALFLEMAGTARDILGYLKAKYDPARFRMIRDATASVPTFAAYTKGLEAYEQFSAKREKTAKLLFIEAKRLDQRSPLGYRGMVDLFTFRGFAHKQEGKPYGPDFQRAQTELMEMYRYVPSSMPKRQKDAPTGNRFLDSNVAFTEGLHFAQIGKTAETIAMFRRAVELVPEDAITWHHIARLEARQGNVAASQEALRKALSINPCIENP